MKQLLFYAVCLYSTILVSGKKLYSVAMPKKSADICKNRASEISVNGSVPPTQTPNEKKLEFIMLCKNNPDFCKFKIAYPVHYKDGLLSGWLLTISFEAIDGLWKRFNVFEVKQERVFKIYKKYRKKLEESGVEVSFQDQTAQFFFDGKIEEPVTLGSLGSSGQQESDRPSTRFRVVYPLVCAILATVGCVSGWFLHSGLQPDSKQPCGDMGIPQTQIAPSQFRVSPETYSRSLPGTTFREGEVIRTPAGVSLCIHPWPDEPSMTAAQSVAPVKVVLSSIDRGGEEELMVAMSERRALIERRQAAFAHRRASMAQQIRLERERLVQVQSSFQGPSPVVAAEAERSPTADALGLANSEALLGQSAADFPGFTPREQL